MFENNMSEKIYCTYCGAKNVSNNVFCENCGQSFEDKPKSTQRQRADSRSTQYQPYQQTQVSSNQSSISGPYDAVPGQPNPYNPPQRRGMPGFVKILLILFFLGIPFLFFLFFYVFARFPF